MSDRRITLGPEDGALIFRAGAGLEIEYPTKASEEVTDNQVLGQIALSALLWSEAGTEARQYLWENVLPLVLQAHKKGE